MKWLQNATPWDLKTSSSSLLVCWWGICCPACDRISIGAKSPLTHGIKEANAGGRTGLQLSRLGIKALIIEGGTEKRAEEEADRLVLVLNSEGVRFEEAKDLTGQGVYQSSKILQERYGNKSAIALIGPAGEMRLPGAGILNIDKDGIPSRIAARGGLGAVMASKSLKAIVIDGSSGIKPPIRDLKAYQAAQKEFTKVLMAHPQTKVYHDFGTVGVLMLCQQFGALPTRNFTSGQFESAELLSADAFRETLIGRGGDSQVSHACMAGCTIQCSNIFGGEDGETIVSPLEFETIGLMGTNLGIDQLDEIARLNWEVNDLGLDSIEVGAALGVAVEAGLLSFGDPKRALALIHEIRQGTPTGRLIGSGPAVLGKAYGIQRIPAVKGQALSAYDPRAIKGTGITYATSPQGGDHTSGLTIRAKVDHLNPKGQVEVSRNAQLNMAGYDTLGACIFAGFGFSTAPQLISALLNARYGWQTDVNILQELGRQTLTLEREFNRLAGFTREDDRLPEWLTKEPLPPTQAVFDVPEEDLDSVFNW